jgi:hypothetical protein
MLIYCTYQMSHGLARGSKGPLGASRGHGLFREVKGFLFTRS